MINFNVLIMIITIFSVGYVCGNIHGAYLIGKIFKKIDIREKGSGNSGTTNALRVMGFKYALPVFLIDFAKAFLPILILESINPWKELEIFSMSLKVVIIALGIIVGHNYPVVLNFKGGKGIASSLGIVTAIDWRCGLIFALCMILIIAVTRYVSLASVITAISIPIMLFFICNRDLNYLSLGIILMLFAIVRHKDNIKRLLNGTERKFGEKVGDKN